MTAKEDEAADALEQALLRATRSVELELARIVKSGEDDLDRLVRRFADALAKVAIEGALGAISGGANAATPAGLGGGGSVNQIAEAIAKAARRGTRFT